MDNQEKCKHEGTQLPVGMAFMLATTRTEGMTVTQIFCTKCKDLTTILSSIQLPNPQKPKGIIKPIPGIGGDGGRAD